MDMSFKQTLRREKWQDQRKELDNTGVGTNRFYCTGIQNNLWKNISTASQNKPLDS